MPRVFANEQTHPTETRVERAERAARREKSPIVEQPIRRQVHFAMHVDDASFGQVRRGDIVTIARVLFDETDHDVEVAARGENWREAGIVGRWTARQRSARGL